MTSYEASIWRRIKHRQLLKLIARGEKDEARRVHEELWKQAHGEAGR